MPDFLILLEQRSSGSMPPAVRLGVSCCSAGSFVLRVRGTTANRNPSSQAKPACHASGMLGRRVAGSELNAGS